MRLEAFGADVANKFAIAGMKLGMPLEESGLLKTLVAALEVANKSLCGSRCSRGDNSRDPTIAGRGHALNNGHLLATGGTENVAPTTAGGDDGRARFSRVHQALNKGCIGAQNRTS